MLPEDRQPNSIVKRMLDAAGLTPLQAYSLGRYMDGLKHREIAEELGVSRRMVTKHIKYAMEKLKRIIPKNSCLTGNQFNVVNNAKRKN